VRFASRVLPLLLIRRRCVTRGPPRKGRGGRPTLVEAAPRAAAEIAMHRQMWKDLGLDLTAHDQLMEALGGAYQKIFLSQKNRPKGMAYLDFVMSEIHGLRVKELIEAQGAGRKVFGTFCLYVPEEIPLAADAICVGLCAGAEVGTSSAERLLPRNTCALIKSFMGFKLDRLCPYVESVDLVIGETTCDGKTKAFEILSEHKPTFVIEVPNLKNGAAKVHWRAELGRLVSKVEEVTGRAITAASLRQGVRIANGKRRAMHRLYRLREADPAPISGLDALLLNQVSFYDDPVRFTQQVNALCDELEERVKRGEGVAAKGAKRVLVSGCPMAAPNWKLPSIIEGSGAVIVGEESCVGERGLRNLVREDGETRDEILDHIAERYFAIDCAVFTPNGARAEDVAAMARAYRADGVIHYALQFCAPYTIESHGIQRRMDREGLPTLRLETDYGTEDVPQLRTRVEAFLETLA
jgi:benzoyl-CoA reductase/2-hydroxyglutaryl-CoA dehydratase subunit BcrC/BadD/HgdB